ncbi:MAG: hypothetical protein Tsb0014_47610 [Pleurocapsa sp.]
MSGTRKWTCDGVAKNGKQYDSDGRHKPKINHTPDCTCGLPREAMEGASSSLPVKSIIIGITAAILLVVGGKFGQNLLVKKNCSEGMQRINSKCIDPYLQTYEKSVSQGETILETVKNYRSLEDLKIAQKNLARVVTQLSLIPQDALIYSDAKAKLEKFDLEQARIYQLVQIETEVQTRISTIIALANEAKVATENATNSSQLKTAKQKWQQAMVKLAEIDVQTAIAPQIEQYKQYYQQQIATIDARLASFVQATSTPTQPEPTFPVDPCAVDPQPDYCVF